MKNTIQHATHVVTGDRVRRVKVSPSDGERLKFLDHVGTVEKNSYSDNFNNFDVIYDQVDGEKNVRESVCAPRDFEKLN